MIVTYVPQYSDARRGREYHVEVDDATVDFICEYADSCGFEATKFTLNGKITAIIINRKEN